MSDGGVRDWHRAAESASFTFFEPVAPGRTRLWAGGFGWNRDEAASLELLALIDGTEVSVETRTPNPRTTRDLSTRLMVGEQLWHAILGEDSQVNLPMSIDVVADDRTIPVAGHDIQFSGVRVAGSRRWSGTVEHAGVVIKVVTPVDAPVFSIQPCRNWALMPEMPPTGD
jgi:hypothetical protein